MPHRRILLKLSGEALLGDSPCGIDPTVLNRIAAEVAEVVAAGTQIALVIGGGNIFRGVGLAGAGMDRVTADQMGMLATVMNALAMQDALERIGVPTRVMSALKINQVCEDYIRRRAVAHLDAGRVALFAAGIGSPFFTTDSAASLRAIEIGADLLIKATKVDGIYSADPVTHPDAVLYPRLTYDRALRENLKVMDATAIVLCRDNQVPLRVMNIYEPGALVRAAAGEDIGSLVESELVESEPKQ
ncbi:Uridylate kinase [Thiorhodovibrio winogradskyi]|uniref:Uridylate kinase n=1 Tax=Thiorhodovibrio winogradskyi TaxID=77007 RepID=A0ABZ0SAI9_9GAMM|nr:UMP kinase [Thiorhodovibrio winogradskyi]